MEIRFAPITVAPVGPLWAGWSDQGLCWLVPHPNEESCRQQICKRYPEATLVRDEAGGARWAADLTAWLAGTIADLPVDYRGLTPFEVKVLTACRSIPRGEVRSYGELAQMIGQPTASRAVGGVMARNPIPLLLPCHRVVQTGGKLGHYGLGGTAVKAQVLALEGVVDADSSPKQGLFAFDDGPATPK